MTLQVKKKLSKRYNFAKRFPFTSPPDLLEVQFNSWRWLLEEGIDNAFKKAFPVRVEGPKIAGLKEDEKNIYLLEYVGHELRELRVSSPEEALSRGVSYAAPLYVTFKVTQQRIKVNPKTGEPLDVKVTGVKEQTLYVGDLPVMTPEASFIVRGNERVVVSQIQRSPGIFFVREKGEEDAFVARIIPYFGVWADIHIGMDNKAREVLMWITLNPGVGGDSKKKIPITTFLRALLKDKSEPEDVLSLFYTVEEKSLEEAIGMYSAQKIKSSSGEVILVPTDRITEDIAVMLARHGIEKIKVVTIEEDVPPYLFNTARHDKVFQRGERRNAVAEVYKALRQSELYQQDSATEQVVLGSFMDERYFDLGEVGRFKINQKLGLSITDRTLTEEDLIETVKKLMDIKQLQEQGKEEYEKELDDIDHLANRRVRSVGELFYVHFRAALARVARQARDKLAVTEWEKLVPKYIVNIRNINGAINEFFGQYALTRMADQVNLLSETTQKRRLAATGPGGVRRERAGAELRDVNPSHYGRVCPVETPEGQNIGLIVSLATYARVNEYGFIVTPYVKVRGGYLETDESGNFVIEYLSAQESENKKITHANVALELDGGRYRIKPDEVTQKVLVRYKGTIVEVPPEEVEYMDVAPNQPFSVSTSLIPFLEHDDSNRALMGSNMQRQAVPLLKAEAPLVGTGVEPKVARDSRRVLVAQEDGEVVYADSEKIIIRTDEGFERTYRLRKFSRTNDNTLLNQRPIVRKGDRVRKGDVIADASSTKGGELALGRNVLIAFMPWRGYNYEDAIVISERLVRDDVFTSVHIFRLEISVRELRDQKLGPEEVTRDIPGVPEEALAHLDENGIVRIGSYVRTGDILVGKVTPKEEEEKTPEYRLLKAIFGEKAKAVKDTSLRMPPGEEGVVVGVERITRQEDPSLGADVREKIRVYIAQKRKVIVGDKFAGRHGNKGVVSIILPVEDMPFLEDGTPVDMVLNPLGVPSRMNVGQVLEAMLGWASKELGKKIADLIDRDLPRARELAREAMPDVDWDSASDEEFKQVASHWKDGIPVATPVFGGATEAEVRRWLRLAGLPESGKVKLFDGRTGEPIDSEVTVGYMYVLKLIHMAQDKIHARSTGPYALITQQPLGGKAQFGAQRLGEMEVWALEAYGAAHTLYEFLTVKSDDIRGRTAIYEAIVSGKEPPSPTIPESVNVLIRELRGLGLNVELLRFEKTEDGREAVYSIDPDELAESIVSGGKTEVFSRLFRILRYKPGK